MKRRDFLQSTGWFVVGAKLVGCTDDDPTPGGEIDEPAGTYTFPQGVASGDPRAASVVLWTRVAVAGAGESGFGAIRIRVEVSSSANFSELIVSQELMAAQATDHTVRVLVTGLNSATDYHYRFVASRDSISGRTRTAPDPTADAQVNLAWVSCQDYTAGHYGSYQQMILDDEDRAPADRIHAVVHLGDMIYETREDGFQTALDDNFEPIMLTNRDSQPRAIGAFPSGGGKAGTTVFANTVEDYRHLYRTFLSDPDLQAARARWPFICVWDDHEFTNDCWQSQANYTGATGDEGSQARRVAASQAWFEYIPAHLTGAEGVKDVASHARDFHPTRVTNTAFVPPNTDNFVPEPNNVAAVGAITIYRSLRFGKHVELVMTDERSYRSDHAIPEEFTANQLFFDSRGALPLRMLNVFDQGNTADSGRPPDSFSYDTPLGRISFPNARKSVPPGTMLGKRQKDWWKSTMKASDATWKIWGNEVPLMRLKLQRPTAAAPPNAQDVDDRVVAGDAWDGYATERKELMTFLKTEAIKNVVVLTGDVHASFAGLLVDDFDASPANRTTVACELIAAGISSNSLFSFFEFATRGTAQRPVVVMDTRGVGGPRFVESLNLFLRHGFNSALTFAGAILQGAPVAQATGAAIAARDDTANPHLKYADTNAQGYGYAKITGTAVAATIVTINRPIAAPATTGPGVKRTASFTIPKDNPAGMTGPMFTGTKPFPET